MPHLHQASIGSGEFSFALTLTIVFGVMLYVRRWLQLRSTAEAIPVRRGCSFLLGLLLIWVAVGPPIAVFDHVTLTGHMIQHLLLMTLAPPLIWLGAPRTLLGRYKPPLEFCWLAAIATLGVWHVPGVFALGMRSHAWHAVEHVSFFVTGFLFWWPDFVPSPSWAVILYLFLATLPCDILSGFLVFSDRIAYPMYLSEAGQSVVSALSDQEYAGALMWTCVTVVYLIAGAILSMQFLSAEHSLNPEDL